MVGVANRSRIVRGSTQIRRSPGRHCHHRRSWPEAAAPPNWSTPPSLSCCAPALRRPARISVSSPVPDFRMGHGLFELQNLSSQLAFPLQGEGRGVDCRRARARSPANHPRRSALESRSPRGGFFGRSLRSRAKTRALRTGLLRKRSLEARPISKARPFRLPQEARFAPFSAQSRLSRSILPFHRAPAAHRAGSVPESARSRRRAHRQLRHGDCSAPRQPFGTRGHRR